MLVPRARTPRRNRRRSPAVLVTSLLVLGVLGFGTAHLANPTAPQAQDSDRSRTALAAEIRDQLRRIRQELIETARDAQSSEAVVAKSEARLAALKAHHAARAGDLSELRGRLTNLTTAMQRLARRPPEAILTSPRPPLETARAMMLVQFMVPDIKREADEIRGELTRIEALNHQIQIEQERFQQANDGLETRRDQLNQLIGHKNALWRDLNNQTPSTDQLEHSATSLSTLFSALKQQGDARENAAGRLAALIENAPSGVSMTASPREGEAILPLPRPDPTPTLGPTYRPSPNPNPGPNPNPSLTPDTRPSEQSTVAPSASPPAPTVTPVPPAGSFAARKGKLTFPAVGRLIARYGEVDSLGLTAKGITLRTRPDAPVVAVHDGKVIYAGPFRGYGRIIIIEHGHGFLTLLAGLERIDVHAGQGVLAGEPVGTMQGPIGIDDTRSRQLYIELRRDGAPVDPLAWLSTQRDTAIQ